MTDISVVVPTYNRAGVLPRALHSVLCQSVPVAEVIVVDDGSTDGTRSAVSAFDDAAVEYVPLPENRGVSVARNRGLDRATGEYVLLLDSDDALADGALATLRARLRSAGPSCVGVSTSYRRLADGLVTDVVSIGDGPVSLADFEDGSVTGGWGASGTMFRRDTLGEVGRFDERLRKGEDFDLFVRALREGYRFEYVDEVLLSVHDRADSITSGAPRDIVTANRHILEKHGDILPSAQVAERHLEIGRARLELGEHRAAMAAFERALRAGDPADRAGLHYRIAIAHAECGHQRAAVGHFLESLRRGSNLPRTAVHLLAVWAHPRCWRGVSWLHERLTARLTHLGHRVLGRS